jgi:hypothetical protein
MRWLRGCGILLALALVLFAVPARFEGPVLVPISPGHGLTLVDVVALAPLLGTGLGLGLLVASVFGFFWWWAVGAGLLTATLLAAAVVAAGGGGAGDGNRTRVTSLEGGLGARADFSCDAERPGQSRQSRSRG